MKRIKWRIMGGEQVLVTWTLFTREYDSQNYLQLRWKIAGAIYKGGWANLYSSLFELRNTWYYSIKKEEFSE